MSEFRRKSGHYCMLRHRIHSRVSLLQRCLLRALHRFLACSGTKPGANANYSMLPPHAALPSQSPQLESGAESAPTPVFHTNELDTDLVNLKISLLGDCQIGKTSFLVSFYYYHYIILFYLFRWIESLNVKFIFAAITPSLSLQSDFLIKIRWFSNP